MRRWQDRKHKVEGQLDAELRFHFDNVVAEHLRAGLSEVEARRRARLQFGGIEQVKEECRDASGMRWLEDLARDIRLACRSLRKSPGFAIVAIVTVALGIGANTAMFSVLNTYLIRALPYPHSEQLVRVFRTAKESQSWPLSTPNFLDYRRGNNVFEYMAAVSETSPTLVAPEQAAEPLHGLAVTADFFPALGVQPAMGRVFTGDEYRLGANPVAVLSYRFWQRRFGGDASILSRKFQIDGQSVEVVGVMPPTFDYPLLWRSIDLWQPLAFTPTELGNRGFNYLQVLGLVKTSTSLPQAQAEMTALAASISAETSSNQNESLRLEPLQRSTSTDVQRNIIWFTFGLTGFVLLIACANLANLQLGRMVARARDHAVRAALGAGRLRLLWQSLSESLVLTCVGAIFGLVITIGVTQFINRRLFINLPGAAVTSDFRVFCFALLCSVLTGLIFGAVPAWFASRADVNRVLTLRSPSLGATSSSRTRRALIVGEVAFALILLTGAGLLLGGLRRFANRDNGWREDGLLTARFALQGPRYATPVQRLTFYRLLEERLRASRGVQQVALSQSGPPVFNFVNSGQVAVEGRPEPAPGQYPWVFFEPVSLGYFDTFGVRLLAGRIFDINDRDGQLPVVIVNESLARQFWPNENPIGKRIVRVPPARILPVPPRIWFEVVGVVNDIGFAGSLVEQDSHLQAFRPMEQSPTWPPGVNLNFDVTIRTTAAPEAATEMLRRVVADLDSTQPLSQTRSVPSLIDESTGGISLLATLLASFALLGLALAALGIYGVTSDAVVQRTGELGLRMALGAKGREVLLLILGQGARLALCGAVIGLVGGNAVVRFLVAMIPMLPTRDPLLAFGLTLALISIVLAACWIPARRATRINPSEALRCE